MVLSVASDNQRLKNLDESFSKDAVYDGD